MELKRRCPSAGHLLLILVRDFAFGCAIELQDGVDTDLPDSLGEGGLLCTDDEFALVFVAAEFALDGYMGAFGEGAGEIGEFPEGHASMPLGARFPRSGIVLPGCLGGEGKNRDVGCVGSLSFGSLPMKPIGVILLRYMRFSLFCPFVSGTRKRVGAAAKTRSCFSGGTGTTGEPEPEGCESKAEAAQTPGAARAPKQCRAERAGRGNVTEQITALLVAAAVGIPQSKPFAIREPRAGSCRLIPRDTQQSQRRRQCNIRE